MQLTAHVLIVEDYFGELEEGKTERAFVTPDRLKLELPAATDTWKLRPQDWIDLVLEKYPSLAKEKYTVALLQIDDFWIE